jgi:hypothetical protein
MSKADKDAQRSAKKEQFFGPSGFSLARAVTPQPSSWWTKSAAPDAREKFIADAKERGKSQWTSILPAPMNSNQGFR